MSCMCDALQDTCAFCKSRYAEQAFRDATSSGVPTHPYQAYEPSRPPPKHVEHQLTAQQICALPLDELFALAERLSPSVDWVMVVRDKEGRVCARKDHHGTNSWEMVDPRTDYSWLFQR